jgi:thiamine kinase-like enzyme
VTEKDANNLTVDKCIDEWSQKVELRIVKITETLMENKAQNEIQLRALEEVKKEFMFEGYKEHFKAKTPRDNHFPIVISHCDGQELNVLMDKKDNEKLILIDCEYGGWNPFAYDIANYLIEC